MVLNRYMYSIHDEVFATKLSEHVLENDLARIILMQIRNMLENVDEKYRIIQE